MISQPRKMSQVKEQILIKCHRCSKEVPKEEIMLIGCKQCGGDNGSNRYGLLEAKYGQWKGRVRK